MSKRRATGQLTPAVTAKRHEAIPGDRARLFSARLKSLNQQFAEWVKGQAASATNQLWLDGVQSYQEYVGDLLEEFKDIVGQDAQLSRQRDVATPVANTLFGTPVGASAAAAAAGGRDNAAAPSTGGSTGRKSVTWADTSTALTPAPGAAANGTPGPNTANAGHTPAPPNFGRFEAGTPGGSDMPTPQFKLPPGSAAGTPAAGSDATPVSQGGRSMFGGSGGGGSAATPASAAAYAGKAAQTPSSSGGFQFGSAGGGFGTPVTAEPDKAARAKDSSSPPAFAFGTPAATAFNTPAAGAADKSAGADGSKAGSQPRAFTFGVPPAAAGGSKGTAAGGAAKSSTPTFGGFGAGSSDRDASKDKDTSKAAGGAASTAGPPFSFGLPPASSSAAAAGAGSPAFSLGVPSSSAAAGGGSEAAAHKGKSPSAFSFGVTSSSAAAGGSSPGFAFGASSSAAAGGSSASPGGFTFGVSSTPGANAGSSSATAAAGSSPPLFAFGASPAAAAGGAGSTPAISFGAGSSPAFGAQAGSTPAFGTPGASSMFGTPATGGFGGAANGTTPGGFTGFNFPKPSEAVGPSAAAAAGDDAGEDEAEPQEEKTPVQQDERYDVLFSKSGILHVSVKNDKGEYGWQNRGKGSLSIRTVRDTGKAVVIFVLEGQGKQLIAHELGPKDRASKQEGKVARVTMPLRNKITEIRKGPNGLPEPVTIWQTKQCIVRMNDAESVNEFINMVEQHKPKAECGGVWPVVGQQRP